jgi:hypothetical protein
LSCIKIGIPDLQPIFELTSGSLNLTADYATESNALKLMKVEGGP